MISTEAQQQIVWQLYGIVSESCPKESDEAKCRFEYSRSNDGSTSVKQNFSYCVNDVRVYALLDRKLRSPVMGLVKELHALMKAHTGGDWNAFTLTIDNDGQVTTRFEYPEET